MADEFKAITNEDIRNDEFKWYVVHTYSGYEQQVETSLNNAIKADASGELARQIVEVVIPKYTDSEVKEKKDKETGETIKEKKTFQRKSFPSYVLVKMMMNEKTWFVVRNIRGVTGFVGPGSKPVPLTEREIAELGVEKVHISIDVEVGDTVKVRSGAFENSTGTVSKINEEKGTVEVLLTAFGRETPVEIDTTCLEKI